MTVKKERKIILITRRTRLEELIARFNTVNQAKFYVEHLGADFEEYEQEHRKYKTALRQTDEQLRKIGLVQVLDRSFLPNFVFGKDDIIVVLGQDGLVANTLKYLNEQPVVGINPDPKQWEGVLLPFDVQDVANIVPEVIARQRSCATITMAKVILNNGQQLYGVNDLFIGPKSHTSIRYKIKVGKMEEQHSSSGIIVSTGLGSTGWLKSILTGARGIHQALGMSVNNTGMDDFQWNANYLCYTVREPWPSKFSQASLVFGKITDKEPMTLVSQMPERGVIFSDGIEDDYLEFNSGTQATVCIADKKGCLVI